MPSLFDSLFPAAKPLKAAAQGPQQAPPANSGTGISQADIAAAAAKDAAKAAAAKTTPAPSSPIDSGKGTRDHYKPRGN